MTVSMSLGQSATCIKCKEFDYWDFPSQTVQSNCYVLDWQPLWNGGIFVPESQASVLSLTWEADTLPSDSVTSATIACEEIPKCRWHKIASTVSTPGPLSLLTLMTSFFITSTSVLCASLLALPPLRGLKAGRERPKNELDCSSSRRSSGGDTRRLCRQLRAAT